MSKKKRTNSGPGQQQTWQKQHDTFLEHWQSYVQSGEFDRQDYQAYLNRPLAYWREFGQRSARGMLQVGVTITPQQVDQIVKTAMEKMQQQTGEQLSLDRMDAYAEGMREELLGNNTSR